MGATYAREQVETLPRRNGAGGRNLASVLRPILEEIAADEDAWGEWNCIATYESPTGAGSAKRAIVDPAVAAEVFPKGYDWDVEARKTGDKESKLYARIAVADNANDDDPDAGDGEIEE